MMTSSSLERRVAPRFAVSCVGELAALTEALEGAISDISVTGCCLDISEDTEHMVGRYGILRMPVASGSFSQSIIPVTIANHRAHDGLFRLGLQFGRLTVPQTRGLITLMDGLLRA